MRWATRAGVHIDRAACAWLIRRFIDPAATFVFVADPADVPADATAFNIPGARYSHHDGGCTFEVLVREYRLAEPGLAALARIVHEADFQTPRPPQRQGGEGRRQRRGEGRQINVGKGIQMICSPRWAANFR